MKKSLLLFFFFTGCSSVAPQIQRLSPLPEPAQTPAACKIVGVLPGSPAHKAGIKTGETIQAVNGAKPTDALAVGDFIDKAGSEANLDVADASGKVRSLKIQLNKEKPRLGASCDLTGWDKLGVSGVGNESLTVFGGPYALTVSGIVDKGMTFMRVHVSNHSDHPLAVSKALFSVTDGSHTALSVLTPEEVIYYMHGEDAVPYLKPPSSSGQTAANAVPRESVVRQSNRPHKKKNEWSGSDEAYIHANADYLAKETLWPTNVEPGKSVDGLIYFIGSQILPFKVEANMEGATLAVSFGEPRPSAGHMTQDQLAGFFEAQKKGTPVRLTLKTGRVFVGKYSSYDAINEIVWFDTPSGILLTTSSFGLKYIAFAEVIAPEGDKKQPAAQPLN